MTGDVIGDYGFERPLKVGDRIVFGDVSADGWDTMLGPGRHPISSCYFWYFKNPCGGAAEYDFDSDVIDDNWEPGEFESVPENFAEWCLAEGMGESLLYKGIQRG